jgi:hypothetical protein
VLKCFFFFSCGQLRRERIAERMKALQELVPNANKVRKLLHNLIDRGTKTKTELISLLVTACQIFPSFFISYLPVYFLKFWVGRCR